MLGRPGDYPRVDIEHGARGLLRELRPVSRRERRRRQRGRFAQCEIPPRHDGRRAAKRHHERLSEDGRVINGRRLNEDTYTVQMADEEGRLMSLNKSDWRANLGAQMLNNPITYAVNGRQYVAAMGGLTLFVFALPN
jgi:hypothetical protein